MNKEGEGYINLDLAFLNQEEYPIDSLSKRVLEDHDWYKITLIDGLIPALDRINKKIARIPDYGEEGDFASVDFMKWVAEEVGDDKHKSLVVYLAEEKQYRRLVPNILHARGESENDKNLWEFNYRSERSSCSSGVSTEFNAPFLHDLEKICEWSGVNSHDIAYNGSIEFFDEVTELMDKNNFIYVYDSKTGKYETVPEDIYPQKQISSIELHKICLDTKIVGIYRDKKETINSAPLEWEFEHISVGEEFELPFGRNS